MKVLLVSSNSSAAGGGEQYLVYLAQGLRKEKIEIAVLLSNQKYMDGWESKFRDAGIEKIYRKELIPLSERKLRIFQTIFEKHNREIIKEVCQNLLPDVVHINQQYGADGLDYIKGALNYKREVVLGTIHLPMALTKHRRQQSLRTFLINLLCLDKIKNMILRKWYNENGYAKIFLTQKAKNEFKKAYGDCSQAKVIHNGVYQKNLFLRKNYPKQNIIAYCGRLEKQKNPMLIIKAWLQSKKNSKLLLIGDGSERKKLEKFLKKKGEKKNWQITGWVEDVYKYYKQIDCLIFASYFEGIPLSLLEAACVGIPIVSTNFSGIEEIAKKIPYLYRALNNPAQLRSAIDEAINLPFPDLGQVEKVRKYFSCKRMAEETIRVYEKMRLR
ncbi:MAG: glycosyltransferase family 4 protein [Candidatus Omnitrophota bacterium]